MTEGPALLDAELTPRQADALAWLAADFMAWLAETGKLPPAAGDEGAAVETTNGECVSDNGSQ